jgi:hypothetical protein
MVVLQTATAPPTPPTPIASAPLSSNGTYTFSTQLFPAGNYQVVAHYGGDSNFRPSDSAATSVTVNRQNSKVIVSFVTFGTNTLSLSTAAQNVQYGSDYILRVDVANNAGTPCQNVTTANTPAGSLPQFVCPTGTVTLSDNGAALKDFPNAQTPGASNVANLNDRGYIEDQPIQLGVGTHSITATYTADANSSYNSQSASNALSVTITKANTTTAVTSNVTSVVSGGSVMLTATVGSNSNSAQGPTGTVQFTNGSSNLGAAATCTPAGATSSAGASCTATLTTAISALPPGFFETPEPQGPSVYLLWLASACALICLLMALRLPKRARVFAYSGVAAFLLVAVLISGCSGAGGSSGGGGGGTGQQRSIGANYSGDSNYASSTGSTTVSVH